MMTVAMLVITAAVGLFVILQQALSRLMCIEVALSQGMPSERAGETTHRRPTPIDFDAMTAARDLPSDAVVVLASATCTSCIRLVDDLGSDDVASELPLHVYFDSDPPTVARRLESKATVHERAGSLIDALGTPALPYGVVLAGGHVAAHGPLPDLSRLVSLTLQADVGFQAPVGIDGPRPEGGG